MSGRVAKKLRKQVYGSDYSPRDRDFRILDNGALVNTGKRAEYLKLKRNYKAK